MIRSVFTNNVVLLNDDTCFIRSLNGIDTIKFTRNAFLKNLMVVKKKRFDKN